MTSEQRMDIWNCIIFYESHGWDWSLIIEFLVLKYSGRLSEMKKYVR